MFKFFDFIANAFKSIISLIIGIIQGSNEAIIFVKAGIDYLFSVLAFMPPILTAIATAVLIIAIIKLIIRFL